MNQRLLLVLPLVAYQINGRILIDSQACNGLRLWLKNFQLITLICPVEPRSQAPSSTLPLDSIDSIGRLTFVELPVAYTPLRFLIHLPNALKKLEEHISQASYLHFAIGGLWGDWASVASLLAMRRGLPFAVWTDRVESQVTHFQSGSKTGFRGLYTVLTARMMSHYEKFIISRSALGLFHGMDCYKAYYGYCRDPHLVHDIHLGPEALITSSKLEKRFLRNNESPLRIAYAGRVHREKGVYDWIEALTSLASQGLDFSATWFGYGPELSVVRNRVNELGLGSRIEFPGLADSHAQLMQELQSFDIFVFCHKTLESPRCLIEALICGLPIVGYETDYARDLIKINGGGLLTPMHDTRKLAGSIIAIFKDRSFLRLLSERASRDGSHFSDESVFRHRSELIKSIKICDTKARR
jgi:glycosyltransferase involved in cell wall biosynthesis